jgi:hypothetical protein
MLAIIIPYFNIAFFEETLQSLSNQIDKRFKVYIGDDASNDKPFSLLKKYEGQFNFVYHRFEENRGSKSLTEHWQRCIELLDNEDWIMILGDDDVLENNVVASFYSNLTEIQTNKINVIRFATQLIDKKSKATSDIYLHPIKEKSTDFIFKKINRLTRSSLSEYVFKREILQKTGFYDFPLAWHSDDMAFLQISNFSFIYTINTAIVKIRMSEGNISGKTDNNLEKNKATELFYFALANNYLSFFTPKQKLKLIGIVEHYYFDKKSIHLFFKISGWHLNQTSFFNYIKFLRRIYINSHSIS